MGRIVKAVMVVHRPPKDPPRTPCNSFLIAALMSGRLLEHGRLLSGWTQPCGFGAHGPPSGVTHAGAGGAGSALACGVSPAIARAAIAMAAAMRVTRRSMRQTSLLDDATRLKGTSDIAHPVWPTATQQGKLTGRRLVITFVPITTRKLD